MHACTPRHGHCFSGGIGATSRRHTRSARRDNPWPDSPRHSARHNVHRSCPYARSGPIHRRVAPDRAIRPRSRPRNRGHNRCCSHSRGCSSSYTHRRRTTSNRTYRGTRTCNGPCSGPDSAKHCCTSRDNRSVRSRNRMNRCCDTRNPPPRSDRRYHRNCRPVPTRNQRGRRARRGSGLASKQYTRFGFPLRDGGTWSSFPPL